MLVISQETQDDWWETETLYDLCFSPGRTALSSYRLREGVPPLADLCLTARDPDGYLAGVIRNWPVLVAGHPVILLGPVAVHPTRQGEGIGGQLMIRVIEAARNAGHDRIMLIGDYLYYARFGFERLHGVDMPPPTNPDRVLGYALKPGAWDNVTGRVMSVKIFDDNA